jgi:surfactin synthase thioesterase subunit
MDIMKLLCFPYAGATGVAFQKWEKYMEGIKVVPLELPGKGSRMAEPLCQTIDEMVDDLKKQMLNLIEQKEDYAVYGHSMGCLLIYELLHDLWQMGFHLPVHVFLSGKNPPDIVMKKTIHQLNDTDFIKKMVEMGGMEARFFENPTLTKLFLPILRTDIHIVETYCPKEKKQRLPVDITFFFSSGDKWVKNKYVKQWANYITGSFQIFYYKGSHFFIFEQEEKITGIIKETLSNIYDDIPY